MRYIYREQHTVLVDHEIELNDEILIENGVNPHNEKDVSEFIRNNFIELNPESTEWWLSSQLNNAPKMVGSRPYNDDSEELIKWII